MTRRCVPSRHVFTAAAAGGGSGVPPAVRSGGGGGGGGDGDDGASKSSSSGWGWKGWQDRVAADPDFAYKVLIEQVCGAFNTTRTQSSVVNSA